MTIGSLIFAIGAIPLMLAISVNRIYRGSKLNSGLFIFMILVTMWQIDVGILYFKDLMSEEQILFLFRFFRLGTTYAILIVFYIAYVIVRNHPASFKVNTFLNRILKFIFNKKMLVLMIIWTSFVYFINWTELGIKGLRIMHAHSISFYFPVYGPLSWVYTLHMSTLVLFLIFVFLISNKISNVNMKNFLRTFSFYSIFLIITGMFNFSPQTGIIASSIGVVVFSIVIMFEFVKLNTNIALNNHQLVERQKKLDYTGSLAGSLIHEVKNTNQVIKGFSKLLSGSSTLSETEKGYLDMIMGASDQLDDLANNYREYISESKIEFKMVDIEQIINLSIEFTKEMAKEKNISVDFINHFSFLKAFANRTYLHQVFINLIKNSCEAIQADKEIRQITIKTDYEGDQIVIYFSDTGCGIPREYWETIFDPFISSNNKGMGLGLPFVKKIIFEHHGDIQIIESTSEGTTFKINIPQFWT